MASHINDTITFNTCINNANKNVWWSAWLPEQLIELATTKTKKGINVIELLQVSEDKMKHKWSDYGNRTSARHDTNYRYINCLYISITAAYLLFE